VRRLVLAGILCSPLLAGFAQLQPEALPGLETAGSSLGAAPAYREAAAAMRRRDCTAALGALAPLATPATAAPLSPLTPLTATAEPDRALATLVSGLYAHACEQVTVAEERLYQARMAGGLLEDWRLFLLADSAHARGHVLVAKAALAKLLGDHPGSPLRPRALARAASLDWEQQDAAGALALVRTARKEELRGEERTQLESLAWEIGTRLGDAQVRTEAARELLVGSPVAASQLGVAEVFRHADGAFSWAGVLSPSQMRQRAEALLALDLEPGSLATLDAVAPADRDLQWMLLKAEVLTRAHRGVEALALLRPLQTGDLHGSSRSQPRAEREVQPPQAAQQMAALEWALAEAADDVAAGLHGRSAKVQGERRKLRLAAQLHLRAAAEIGGDPALSIRALRALYAHLIEEDLFDPAVETLHRLRALDPHDTTGVNLLWGRGWQDFSHRNFTGAIGYWAELGALYPEDSANRRARYWSARSFEALGERDRARALFAELAAADTGDFYRRNATLRLASWQAAPATPARAALAAAATPPSAPTLAEPWPYDPALVRAQLLTDLGLDDLAWSEAELVRGRAQPRAVAALEALILARRGERRKSVTTIREAFPALGGPLQATVPEAALKLYYPLDFEQPIRASAVANGLPPELVFGVIRQESAFDATAQSRAGACGLMQLMPGTARELARGLGLGWSRDRLTDPAWNVQLGTSYLRQVIAMFGGNLELALAGYNGGPYRVKRLWREAGSSEIDRFLEGLSIEESKVYVKRILVLSDSYRRLYPHAAG
jgi:soluble lytic murein transglycosylase-like protein